MEIIYRKLGRYDAESYRQIRLESLQKFPEAFGSSYDEELIISKLRFEQFIEEELPDKFMWGAFDNGVLIGICGFIREEQQKSRHRGIIIQMYVKEPYGGKHVGRTILNKLILHAFDLNGLEMITLGVMSDNEPALKLYVSTGFIEYGRLDGYFLHDGRYLDQKFMVLTKDKGIKIQT